MHIFYYTFLILIVRFHIESIIDIAIHVVQIIDTPHTCRTYVSFTRYAIYIAVRCGFDKHLYLISCLNAHNHNTCIRLPQTVCTTRTMALFIIIEDRQAQVLAGDAMATTIIIEKLMISVIIVTDKVFHCFCL